MRCHAYAEMIEWYWSYEERVFLPIDRSDQHILFQTFKIVLYVAKVPFYPGIPQSQMRLMYISILINKTILIINLLLPLSNIQTQHVKI